MYALLEKNTLQRKNTGKIGCCFVLYVSPTASVVEQHLSGSISIPLRV